MGFFNMEVSIIVVLYYIFFQHFSALALMLLPKRRCATGNNFLLALSSKINYSPNQFSARLAVFRP